jgi:hypothetical protein
MIEKNANAGWSNQSSDSSFRSIFAWSGFSDLAYAKVTVVIWNNQPKVDQRP